MHKANKTNQRIKIKPDKESQQSKGAQDIRLSSLQIPDPKPAKKKKRKKTYTFPPAALP